MKAFRSKNFAGIQAFGWQVDVRFDGWLPFSVRRGYNPRDRAFMYVWRVPILGWAVTAGQIRDVRRAALDEMAADPRPTGPSGFIHTRGPKEGQPITDEEQGR